MAKILLNVKTDADVKRRAQCVAKELGIPLSTVVNAYLKEFIREREVRFSLDPEPRSEVAEELLRASRDRKRKKNISKRFKDAESALDYLHS